MNISDPKLCYVLDGFLGLYGLIITGMFIKEKFFKSKLKSVEESPYASLNQPTESPYSELNEAERGRFRHPMAAEDSTYTGLKGRQETYRELPVKRERQRKKEQVYQGLSSATRDTYDSLQMQPLSIR